MDDDAHFGPTADVLHEQDRLNTFRCWPHSAAVSPPQLAKAGFYYLGQADRVMCAFCGGTLRNWEYGDDPWTEHRKHYRECPFVQGQDVGNVPLPASRSGSAISNSCSQARQAAPPQGLDIGPEVVPATLRLNPIHSAFQSVDSRRETFIAWSSGGTQRPEDLVQAGFFYTGHGDSVRCFCCDGTLQNWEPNDDPWEQHARWFPRCPFLLQQKGLTFIMGVQDRHKGLQQRSRSSPQASPGMPRKGPASPKSSMSLLVKQALEMGFESSVVNRTLQQIVSSSGGRLPSLDRLVNALVNGDTVSQPSSGQESGARNVAHSQATSRGGHSGEGTGEAGCSDRTLCKVCMEREVEVTFMPCGHLVCCSECVKNIRVCPVCRQGIRASIRTYLC